MKVITKEVVLDSLKVLEIFPKRNYRSRYLTNGDQTLITSCIEEIRGYIEQQSSNRTVQTLSMLSGYREDYCFRVIYNGDEIEINADVMCMPIEGIYPINEELLEVHIDSDVISINEVEFKKVKKNENN